MAYESIPLEAFHETFKSNTELSSVALGGKVVTVSDEFFAEAFHLLEVEPAPSLKGQFGPNGALYSGWETRRHNPSYDWCVIKLGTLGTIVGFDIDTTHFNGNEAPEVSVDGIIDSSLDEHDVNNAKWTEILPRVPLGPSQRHLFKIAETEQVKFVKLNMYPDGGIARFRVYGNVAPVQPDGPQEVFDLAHVFAGGRVTFMSDQHFGVGANLILPGRGKDMGDGWETKRSRQKGHKDWVIIKLQVTKTSQIEIDTAHFKGNFPETCELHALCSEDEVPDSDAADWTQILSPVKLGPHRRHFFALEADVSIAYTHVKLTIYPDGGIKRVRVYAQNDAAVPLESAPVAVKQVKTIPAYGDHTAAPPGTKITPANQGSATKFHKLSLLESSYPAGLGASSGLSVYRCNPTKVVNGGVELKVVERHPYTNQAFIPMGGGGIQGDEALKEPGSAYLVVVAHNGTDDKPDFNTLRAFVASAGQGIMYNTAIWHQPMTVLYKPMDFTCVETQIGNGDKADCEILELEASEVVILALPRH
ncbi:galactose-binding domain-like protein [Suillus subaureus]|uniref:Galactose-binding domain-like protein n=1 Tax=Suillus subaureus TaxID=48587 RepID=A0A9P7J997_9AGAM|nr:galactose-binding domain-like protein [Suillus subaureus]KAG1809352.1 galactose-binding domain-like protein [Suillus subaureus]